MIRFLVDAHLPREIAWGREPTPTRRDLPRLHTAEAALYDDLRNDAFGEVVRLEQERVRFSWLERALQADNPRRLPATRHRQVR